MGGRRRPAQRSRLGLTVTPTHAPPSSQQRLGLPLDLNLTSGRILACRFLLSPKETTTMNTHLFSLPRPQRLLALGAFSILALAVLAGCSG